MIFVDDLDRCLPSNALEVLESMKLFFDVQGCVFVVGLDQAVAERAVAQKYAVDATATTEQTPVSGVDYLKKIFQVPFALPRIGTDQLQGYCHAMLHGARLAPAQIEDFNHNVSRHLAFLPEQDSVNPREIKRLINAYVLQVKMLRLRLGPSLDPNMVLVLQILSFRTDWRDFYEGLAADPMLFQRTVRAAVEERPAAGTDLDERPVTRRCPPSCSSTCADPARPCSRIHSSRRTSRPRSPRAPRTRPCWMRKRRSTG